MAAPRDLWAMFPDAKKLFAEADITKSCWFEGVMFAIAGAIGRTRCRGFQVNVTDILLQQIENRSDLRAFLQLLEIKLKPKGYTVVVCREETLIEHVEQVRNQLYVIKNDKAFAAREFQCLISWGDVEVTDVVQMTPKEKRDVEVTDVMHMTPKQKRDMYS